MRCAILLVLSVAGLDGAVVRGIVTEALTGNPLARTLLQIEPIQGTPGQPRTIRAGERGSFEFSGLAAGGWVLKATRPGFLPIENGQRKWNSSGFPLILTADDAPFVTLRMQRFGAVKGTVRDSNEIGIPAFDVAAWRAAQPPRTPQIAARGKTDDRGVYRISGLEPGTYYVRSGAHLEEELSFVPTFATATMLMEGARQVEVFADEEVHDFDLRPLQGKLFRISGEAVPLPDTIHDVTVTLASEMGREVRHGARFQFTGLAPGEYELYAEAHDDPPGTAMYGGYSRFTLSQNLDTYLLNIRVVQPTSFTFVPGSRQDVPGQLFGRRKDLAGVGNSQPVTITDGSAMLAVGPWELLFVPNPGSYVSSFNGPSNRRIQKGTPDGWNETLIQGFSYVRYGISGGGGMVAGVVRQNGTAVAGAPVFLEGYDSATHRRVVDPRVGRSGLQGEFRFDGLPPGTYRICSTFEYLNPDAAAFDLIGAESLRVDANQTVGKDLELFGEKYF